jgi:hypothetical protein
MQRSRAKPPPLQLTNQGAISLNDQTIMVNTSPINLIVTMEHEECFIESLLLGERVLWGIA